MKTAPKIVVITGPTASGKSSRGLEIAEDIGGEIVNADSVQVYRYFDIGSAKPTESELGRVRHHLISILNPDEEFNAGKFCALAGHAIDDIVDRGKVPVIIGGTGLYIQALLNGLVDLDEIPAEVRNTLEDFEASVVVEKRTEALYGWLSKIDPQAAQAIDARHTTRIRRAILVKLAFGNSIVDYQAQHQFEDRKYNALVLAIYPDRTELYHRINSRTDEMIECGLLEETKQILARYGQELKPIKAIGYKSAVRYLNGIISKAQLSEEIKRDTRRYAKRQLTWWKNQPAKLGWTNLHLGCQEGISATSIMQAVALTKDFLQYKQGTNPEEVSFVLINSLG